MPTASSGTTVRCTRASPAGCCGLRRLGGHPAGRRFAGRTWSKACKNPAQGVPYPPGEAPLPFGTAQRTADAVAVAREFSWFREQVMGKILLNLVGTVM